MTTATALPVLLTTVEVTRVERLSPNFVRVALGSPDLAELGVDEHSYDQRFKLIFPTAEGRLPDFSAFGEDWYTHWVALPEDERGHMRTYTVRGVEGDGADTALLVDIVVHEGETGPGGEWAMRARVGDRLGICAPRRGHVYGGIEFAPGEDTNMLLLGDETAVPAVAAILEQLPPNAGGAAFLEVPSAADVLPLTHPAGVSVNWFPRNERGAERGAELLPAVLAYLGETPTILPDVDDAEVDVDLWETPQYSSSGEALDEHARAVGHDWHGVYAWIAGEAKVVTGIRRALVNDLGLDRHQVAFMGYWRQGVAMRG